MLPCWTEILNQELIWLLLIFVDSISWVRAGKLLELWLLCEKAKAKMEYSYFNHYWTIYFIVYVCIICVCGAGGHIPHHVCKGCELFLP